MVSRPSNLLIRGSFQLPKGASHALFQPPITNHQIRNRIKCHRKVRAGDLVPHEWNFRLHPAAQRAALAGIYQEIGFARSLIESHKAMK
jgi:hypothetical protein